MKKIFALTLALLCMCTVFPVIEVYAEEATSESTEYFEDGSYVVTQISFKETRASNTRSGSKAKTYYASDNTKLFSLTVHGVFTYNGSTASCTSSSFAYNVYDSSWSFKSATASKSGATATASGTFVKKVLGITTMTKTLTPTLTCDKDGNLS